MSEGGGMPTTGAKAFTIPYDLRGPEGPLFHGGAYMVEFSRGLQKAQKITFTENCICRDEPAVLLIKPKPLPRTTFEGNPKFTMLKTLKNSARISSVPNSVLP